MWADVGAIAHVGRHVAKRFRVGTPLPSHRTGRSLTGMGAVEPGSGYGLRRPSREQGDDMQASGAPEEAASRTSERAGSTAGVVDRRQFIERAGPGAAAGGLVWTDRQVSEA